MLYTSFIWSLFDPLFFLPYGDMFVLQRRRFRPNVLPSIRWHVCAPKKAFSPNVLPSIRWHVCAPKKAFSTQCSSFHTVTCLCSKEGVYMPSLEHKHVTVWKEEHWVEKTSNKTRVIHWPTLYCLYCNDWYIAVWCKHFCLRSQIISLSHLNVLQYTPSNTMVKKYCNDKTKKIICMLLIWNDSWLKLFKINI